MTFVKLTLDDVCDLITCGVAKRPNYVDNGIPFLSARNVKNQKVIWDNYRYISKDAHIVLTKNNKPRVGDILYTRVGSYGEAAIVDKNIEFSVFVSLTLIKPGNKIFNKYLTYYLNSPEIKKLAKKSISGSGVGNLNVSVVRKFPILLPPLPIQQKIVAKLDKIFAEIDKVYQLLNKKIKNINFLRESFLDTKLKKINSKVEMSIDEFCYTTDFVANGSFASLAANVKYLDEVDYAILVRLTDYRKNFKSKLKYLTKKSYDFLKHSKLFEGDLILTNVGAYCGTPFLIPKLNKPATLGPNAVLIRPKKEIMSSEFLKNFFESRKGQNLLEAISTGTSHKKFNKTSLRKLKITIPTTVQQSKILDDINKLNNRIRIIEQHTKNNLKNFEFLKQSILQKAFNGELIKVS
jgi:type I restriction enzyme S subunit